MSIDRNTGIGTTIPPVQLPGGLTISGDSAGGHRKMPSIKSEKPKPKYTSVMEIPSWKLESPAQVQPAPPTPEGPTFDIKTKLPGLQGKSVGTQFEMSIKATLKGIREDDRGIRYEIEVNSVAL
jgi:hypothetical protein